MNVTTARYFKVARVYLFLALGSGLVSAVFLLARHLTRHTVSHHAAAFGLLCTFFVLTTSAMFALAMADHFAPRMKPTRLSPGLAPIMVWLWNIALLLVAVAVTGQVYTHGSPVVVAALAKFTIPLVGTDVAALSMLSLGIGYSWEVLKRATPQPDPPPTHRPD